ncbi:MAG: MMPL family transporter, partial [Bacillus sp. (in: firmicutes)]
MKKSMNWRSASLIGWIIITVLTLAMMPNLDQLVREKGQIEVPDSAQSQVAIEMMKELEGGEADQYQIIAVFHNKNKEQLTEAQLKEIEATITELQEKKEQLGISDMMTHLDNEQTESQLVSEDGTTILTQLSVDKDQGEITDVTAELKEIISSEGVKTYLTGNDLVMEDFMQSTQDGVKKTEVIAIIFIIIVLIIVFRSPIVPMISLLSVGVSYIVSLGVVAHLVDQFNFPFSNFTQVFLVVILFGIGTDYNILLFTRFKEELAKQEDVLTALKVTYKSAGKTVLYSGIAVFIGFTALMLAEFKLYQASSAVAVGVAVLLVVLMTLNPFFMALLGKKMFWPSKKFEGHADSKIWGFLAKMSVLRPLVALIFVAILCVPFVLSYSGTLSYNDLQEINDKYESKQGINVIEEHFSPGFSAMTSLVISSDETMDNEEYMQALDQLTQALSKVDGVSKVFSVTRPAGEKIDELYVEDQTNVLNDGLGEANDGVGQINEGLTEAEGKLGEADTNSLDDVETLISGTNEVKDGVSALGDALAELNSGMNDGAAGAEQLTDGLETLQSNIATLSDSTSTLLSGYQELESGLSAFGSYFDSLGQAISGAQQGYAQIEASMMQLIESNPELASDVNVQTTLAIASSGKEQLGELALQLEQLTPQFDSAMSAFGEANNGLSQVNSGLAQLETGAGQLKDGAAELQSGMETAASGSSEMANKTPLMESGLSQISDGQQQLLDGLTSLSEQMETLQSGLAESTEGLDEISAGLTDAQNYLNGLSESSASSTLYIPQDVLESEDFIQAMDMYMSEDRTMTSMNIILDVNPYSKEAMDIIEELDDQLQSSMKSGILNEASVALGGRTMQNVDLQEIASGDFLRTATIMLIGIGLVLIVITRSILKPIFIIASLIAAYYTSIGMSELIANGVLGMDYLSWNVPFFSFIMIVALGVDYSIFLMMRYRENEEDSTKAIVEAARHIGGVVISAAIILGGTFAALIPSGVITLIEVATAVIIGLFLLSFVMLPIL